MTRAQFVQQNFAAVNQLTQGTGLFPLTVLSVAILESSENGQVGASSLAANYNNYFGIKASPDWTGQTVDIQTEEYDNSGNPYTTTATWRVYPSFAASAADYVNLITGDSRYADVLTAPDTTTQFQLLQQDGYSTSPSYTALLIDVYNSIRGFVSSAPGSGLAALLLIAFFLRSL